MYQDIFKEIVSITHQDYSGTIDKQGWDDPKRFEYQIRDMEEKNTITRTQFVDIVQDYLLDFNDHHMHFRLANHTEDKQYDHGFKVRRYNNLLYVTHVGKEHRLEQGQAVVTLDGICIPDLLEKHKRVLMEKSPEREEWDSIISQYTSAEIIDEGGRRQIDLKAYEKEAYIPQYSLEAVNEDTLLMTLTDFMNHEAIIQLVKEHEAELTTFSNLIIDVRVNNGGSDAAFYELLPYLFEDDVVDLDSFDEDTMLMNCTHRNAELRIAFIQDYLASINDKKTRTVVNAFLREYEKHKGEGFVEFDLSDVEEGTIVRSKKGPENIVVLTDVSCGSSGDSFVETCKKSSKVTVVGRPTAGLNDYSNLAVVNWKGLFELWYPTSRLSRIDKGQGMTGIGIEPDVYIPWTPEHIFEDVDLKKGLELLK